MRRHELGIFSAFFFIMLLSGIASAQYWYQFGVRAGNMASQNNGAAVTIQTITPQTSPSGSIGYWVGEDLSNGAFLQAGYVIENISGSYPSECDLSGCKNYQDLNAGDAEWFYEYFPSKYDGGFLGGIGSDNSAGDNNTLHNYAFYYSNGMWYFTFDGQIIGSVNLGTQTSGPDTPVAFGEVANTSGNTPVLPNIIFQNLSVYKNGGFLPVQQGTAYIGYGVGSKQNLKNPYGVEEMGNRVNYFAMGSNLPQPQNGTILWNLGYSLSVSSPYGNTTPSTIYVAYSQVKLFAPMVLNFSNGTREVFVGWKGNGLGAYSGSANSTTISMNSNITETAMWQRQYYLNVSSAYGSVYGSGWYNAGSTASYGLDNASVQSRPNERELFDQWNNSYSQRNGNVVMNSPLTIIATWDRQFLVSAQAQYGNITGNGWYDNNSIANISIDVSPINVSAGQKLGFYSWSNGNRSTTISVEVIGPLSIQAQFKNLYQINFEPQTPQGSALQEVSLYMSGNAVTNGEYLFGGENYTINYATYKGVKMAINSSFAVGAPGNVHITLPVYNVAIETRDIFGQPVDSQINLSFSNGSTVNSHTGSQGDANFENVPYGYVNGSVTYLGITQRVSAQGGGSQSFLFISILNIGAFALVVIVMAAAYFAARRRFRKSGAGELTAI